MSSPLLKAARRLSAQCSALTFDAPATLVYQPLVYAWEAHRAYLQRYGGGEKKMLFVGINPGPWGMAQTGVPFGDVTSVRDWLGISAPVETPPTQHPKRAVRGFDCPRREISGERLWAFFRARYQTAENFFAERFVVNYCPLLFLREDGGGIRNITPDKLSAANRKPLYAACDDHLRECVSVLRAQTLVGVGGFAEARLREIFADDHRIRIGKIMHPSPASPAANKNFAAAAAAQLDYLESDND